MGETTGIGWTDHTFNPWIGCTKVSAGCKFCYAETQNNRYQWNPEGWGKGKPRKRTSEANWKKPLEWARKAIRDGIITRVFCASLADVFDPEVPQEWRFDLWDLITGCSNPEEFEVSGSGLEWLILTKRPENLWMLPDAWLKYPPSWVRIGVTGENQENWDRRTAELLRVWKGKNFVSVEPMLGPVTLNETAHQTNDFGLTCDIDWVICGGESGPGCRPMHTGWAESLRFQCLAAGVPFFMKQLGGHPNKRHDPEQWPEYLRVQEWPEEN
jgi:protein gp37